LQQYHEITQNKYYIAILVGASDLLKMGYIIVYPIFCLDLFLILFVKTDAFYWMKGVGTRSFAGVFSEQLPVMRAADRIVREQSVRE